MSLEGIDTSWLIPWADRFLGHVDPGENPWSVVIPILNNVFYPSVNKAFRPQLWVLLGIFILSALIILAGLVLRLIHGRLWIVHRIDGLVMIPNISVCYGLSASTYSILGMISIVNAIQISQGDDYPRYYIGLQGAWPALLWLGMYAELWATWSAWWIRRFGTEGSKAKVYIAAIIPWLPIIVAIVPPAVLFTLAGRGFNNSFEQFLATREAMRRHEASWTPADGLDLSELAQMVQPAARLSQSLIDSYRYARIAFAYSAGVLLLTLFGYLLGATLEIKFLQGEAAKLYVRPVIPVMRDRRKSEQLEEEWVAGVRRQARLLRWAARNRAWTCSLIGLMLLESFAIALSYALTPRTLQTNSAQFTTLILIQCYMNGVLSTLVSLLILFRSLDGSSPAARRLQALFPFLPLPPSVGLRSNGKEAGAQRVTHEFKQTTTEMLKGKKPSDGDEELPVMVQLANERRAEGEREREENGEKDWIRRDSEATIL